jgi:hypothetical protein
LIDQSVRLYQTLRTNGICVTTIAKRSAGSRGSRRRHGRENGSTEGVLPAVALVTGPIVLLDRL